MTYNFFKTLKLERKETIHSSMICAIASYNQATRMSFFEMLKNAVHTSPLLSNLQKDLWCNNIDRLFTASDGYAGWIDTEHILKEKVNNEIRERGRADIWVGNKSQIDASSYRLVIENKIDASNQDHQLRRYYRYLIGNGRINCGLFYLCLDDTDKRRKRGAIESAATFNTESKKSVATEYVILTYKHDIEPWLGKILINLVEDSDFKTILKQYHNIIKELCQ